MFARGMTLALALLAVLPNCSGVPARTQLARETAEYISRKFGLELTKDAVSGLARRIEALAVKHGDDVFPAVRNVGPEAINLIAQAERHAGQSAHLLARYSQRTLPIVGNKERLAIAAQHGDDAAEAMIKHAGIEPLLLAHGKPAASAFNAVSVQEGRSLLMMAEKGELVQLGRTPELFSVIAKYGDPAVDYVWKHKGKLVAAAALTAFLASPETHVERKKTTFEIIHNGMEQTRKLIIFVHGLGGDHLSSFSASQEHVPWPHLMKGDTEPLVNQWSLSNYFIALLEYPAGPNDRLSIPEIAQNISGRIRTQKNC